MADRARHRAGPLLNPLLKERGVDMFKTVLIATDGSSDSERAFALARSLATEADGRLVIVHVTEIVGGKGGVYPQALDDDEIKVDIEAKAAELRAQGVDAEAMVETIRAGGPAHVIADVAESQGADVIVVGTRGRSPVGELILGSVPVRLLHIAHRPVLVVPPPARS
jgi:nucleotide-binding universal stress UspA family protein